MPLYMTMSILASVGKGGKNDENDVRTVQNQLNALMNPPRKYLTVDGKVGKKTVGTIRDFQRSVCRFRNTDGRVDPGGKTERHLNSIESEGAWAGCSMMPTDYIAEPAKDKAPADAPSDMKLPAGTSRQVQRSFDKVWTAVHKRKAVAADKEVEKFISLFLDTMVNTSVKDAKPYVAMLDLLCTAVEHAKLFEIAKTLKLIHTYNFSNVESTCKWVMTALSKHGAGKTMRGLAAIGKNAKLAGFFRSLGRIAAFTAIFFSAIEAENHYRKGHYGAAVKELYKCGGGIASLPLAIIDSIETIWKGLDPGIENRRDANVLFEIIRHGNILDHGGNAMDAVVTITEVCVKGVMEGKIDMELLDKLVERMRNSAGKNFVELGEFLGDWYYDRLVEAGEMGEDIGDYIGREYGTYLLPIIKYFDL